MTNFEMIGLIVKQSQVFNPVIFSVCVPVVHYFLRAQVSAYVLLHDVTMFKQELLAACRVSWVWMIVRDVYYSISCNVFQIVFLPVFTKFAALTKHAVLFPNQPPAIHRVLVTAYISYVRWIGGSEIERRPGTTLGTIFRGAGFVCREILTAISADPCFCFVGMAASIAAKPVLIGKGWLDRKLFSTMFADLCYAHLFYSPVEHYKLR
jgi:hypothetical protein